MKTNEAKRTQKLEIPLARTMSLALPERERKIGVQAEINEDLINATKAEIRKNGYTIRQIMEWAFKSFLIQSNPETARKLGYIPKK